MSSSLSVCPQMFEKVSRKKKQEALLLNAHGMTEKEAAQASGVAERTLRRAKEKFRKFGNVEEAVKTSHHRQDSWLVQKGKGHSIQSTRPEKGELHCLSRFHRGRIHCLQRLSRGGRWRDVRGFH